LPPSHVRQGMFDGHALPPLGTPLRRLLAFPQLLPQGFIGMHADTPARGAGRTPRSQRPPAHVAAGNFTLPPGSKGLVTPPGHCRSWRSHSHWNALWGKYGPWCTGQALQKMVKVSGRCCTHGLATAARSMCQSRRVQCCAARSVSIASVTLASGALAGVTPTATLRRESRSRSPWRLSPSTSRLRLFRPWRLSASSTLRRHGRQRRAAGWASPGGLP
jgi:hypothetical protein